MRRQRRPRSTPLRSSAWSASRRTLASSFGGSRSVTGWFRVTVTLDLAEDDPPHVVKPRPEAGPFVLKLGRVPDRDRPSGGRAYVPPA